jgi:hypothetical protein
MIGLKKLQKKVGSSSPEKKFKFFIKQIAEDGHLPDYDIELRGENVVFSAQRPSFTKRQTERYLGLPATPSPALLDKARRAAPGFDIYELYREWLSFAESRKEPPKSIDAAFLGFCKSRARKLDPRCSS